MSGSTRDLTTPDPDPVARVDHALASVEALFEPGAPVEVRRRARRRLAGAALLLPVLVYLVIDIGDPVYGVLMSLLWAYMIVREVRALRTGESGAEVDDAVLATRVLNAPWPADRPDLEGHPRLIARLHDIRDRLGTLYGHPIGGLALRAMPWLFGITTALAVVSLVIVLTAGTPVGIPLLITGMALFSALMAWFVHGRNRRHDAAVRLLEQLLADASHETAS